MKLVATVAVLASLVLSSVASTAFAQSPTQDAYSNVDAVQQVSAGGGAGGGESGGGGGGAVEATTTTASNSGGGALPFTGLEVGLIALLGAGLVGTGFLVRRLSRSEPAGA
jgi:hypothetical protein